MPKKKETKMVMRYHDYVYHLRFQCQNIRKACPHGCREMLDKETYEDHFLYHECS